ncbi:MAG: 5'-nucleotidase C-terminal domain-containing protein [Pseudomonadota bacterium]
MLKMKHLSLLVAAMFVSAPVLAENVTVLHIGDQESWLISAQGNLRDTTAQAISFYGGIDRLATVIANAQTAATAAGKTVIKLNAGDAFLPGPRFTASLVNLATAHADGGQDFYDTIAMRKIGFDATVFGNHEFDNGSDIAARFAEVSNTTYLSSNLNFNVTPQFAALAASGKVAPYKVVTTTGGKKIGIVGATTPLLPSISSPAPGSMLNYNPANTEAQNIAAIIPLIQAQIDDLRNNKGVSTVIVMSHLQNASNEINLMIPNLTGVDLVVSGGGHELMSDTDDLLINGGVAPTFNTHPVFATSAEGKQVAVLTGHFGNRYVGEVNLTIDDTTGALTSVDSTRMIRVTGAAADADRVTGDAQINAQVVAPVSNYIAALNAQIIGTSAVALNGTNGVLGTSGNYISGVRNAETGLGNLVADAMRFAGNTDVAIQNGGGIRTSIAGPGNVSVGDTFNVLPFTNLVKVALSMNATQLKDILEHAYGATSPSGAVNGRYAQVSGMKITYNSANTARTTTGTGNRIVRVVLDDGTVLINNGAVVNTSRTFSFTTIDFTANGGDAYPFAANNVLFENSPFTVTYQEALANYIQSPKAAGGLGRIDAADGDEITSNLYGTENALDLNGRLIDVAAGVVVAGTVKNGTAGRDTIIGTNGNDTINGGAGADTLTGGAGADTFVYTSIRDAGDIITDFTPYADKIDLTSMPLKNIALDFVGGKLQLVDVVGGVSLQFDADGFAGPATAKPLVTLKGLTAKQVIPARDLVINQASSGIQVPKN